MIQTTFVLMAVSGLMLAGVGANEMTHGGVAEGTGLGHQHMADYGGYHCADPEDMDWERHQEHMHADGQTAHCGDGHMDGMHGGRA